VKAGNARSENKRKNAAETIGTIDDPMKN